MNEQLMQRFKDQAEFGSVAHRPDAKSAGSNEVERKKMEEFIDKGALSRT